MSGALHRLGAVVRADVLIRLRRLSTAVLFVLLSAIPYMWIPDPSTGRTLMQIDGQRALYNSAAIGMATALLGALFIGLFGFYVVSNALRKDVVSRCGTVIASTTMRAGEYLLGKFAGNAAFLTLFTLGYMAVAMAMVVVRGEASLEPWLFAKQYLILLPPTIVFVSAIALVFECTPLLRTKLGDVGYFFLWFGMMGAAASKIDADSSRWAAAFDVSGTGFIMLQLREVTGIQGLAIGASQFDAAKPPFVFEGLSLGAGWLAPRLLAAVWPLVLLLVARLFFHRFDPARVRVAAERTRRSWAGRANALAKPVARLVVRIGEGIASLPLLPRFLRASITDATATLAAFPLVVVGILGFAIAAINVDATSLFTGLLPFAFAACAIAIADVASREKRFGTMALTFAAPSLRGRFVAWKFASTLLVALAFLGVPVGRAIALQPERAVELLVAVGFVAAAATALGIVTANPKAFIVLFLTFWYVTTNDRGATPSFDYAGFFGAATPAVTTGYAVAGLVALAAAGLVHAMQLRRRW